MLWRDYMKLVKCRRDEDAKDRVRWRRPKVEEGSYKVILFFSFKPLKVN